MFCYQLICTICNCPSSRYLLVSILCFVTLPKILCRNPSCGLHFLRYPKLMTLFWKEVPGIRWAVLCKTGLASMAPPLSISFTSHLIYNFWDLFSARPPLREFSFSPFQKVGLFAQCLASGRLSWNTSSTKASASGSFIHFQTSELMVQFVLVWDFNPFGAVRWSVLPRTSHLGWFPFCNFCFVLCNPKTVLLGKEASGNWQRNGASFWCMLASHQGSRAFDPGLLWCSPGSEPHQILLNATWRL